MALNIEKVAYKGWANNVRLGNGTIDLVVTQDVGPRVVRLGFTGERNLFAEIKGQAGGTGEKEWKIRGGHRLWLAPEAKPKTYELDNVPIEIRRIPGGIRTVQPVGELSGIQRFMDIRLASNRNRVDVVHTLVNRGRRAVELAPWALTVMAPRGVAIIPLPAKVPHTKRLTHNQEWSLWGYTDFTDKRWTLGSRYLLFRQDPRKGPNKLGLAQREGWVAYQLQDCLFVKRFAWIEGARYADGGVNFETFSNEDFLEVETLGPLVTLAPGKRTSHVEQWQLFNGVKAVKNEADVVKHIEPLVRG